MGFFGMWRRHHPMRGGYSWSRFGAALCLLIVLSFWPAYAEDVSAPAVLQLFEARWDTIENRMVDLFVAGYGGMWLPPPSKADSGSLSVGYDVFHRFDLESATAGDAVRYRNRPQDAGPKIPPGWD